MDEFNHGFAERGTALARIPITTKYIPKNISNCGSYELVGRKNSYDEYKPKISQKPLIRTYRKFIEPLYL